MIKRKRDLIKLAETEGLKKVSIIQTNGNHYRVEGLYLGHKVKFVTSYSPSDHRTQLNLRGYIRRSMRAIASEMQKRKTPAS